MKRLTIIGNLGRDPELRADKKDNSFVTFSVAVSVGSKENLRTDWIEVSCNGKTAELAVKYAKKGHKVFVEGFPSVSAYTNRDKIIVPVQRLSANSFKILNRNANDSTEEISVDSHETLAIAAETESQEPMSGTLTEE